MKKQDLEFYREQYHRVFTSENIQNRPYSELYEKKKRDVLAFFGKKEDGIILDVGCGFGRVVIPLAGKNKNFVVGMDISAEMIKKAKNYLRENNVQNAHLIVADAEFLPFKSGSIKYTVSLDITPHLRNPLNHLAEMKRVITSDGCILVDISNKNPLWILVYPEFMLRSVKRHIRLGRLFDFLSSGCVDAASIGRITHYYKNAFRELLRQAGLTEIECLKFGRAFIVKWYLFVVKKNDD